MGMFFLFGGVFCFIGFLSRDPSDRGKSDWRPRSPASPEYMAWKYAKKHTRKDRLPPQPPLNGKKDQQHYEPLGPCGFGC